MCKLIVKFIALGFKVRLMTSSQSAVKPGQNPFARLSNAFLESLFGPERIISIRSIRKVGSGERSYPIPSVFASMTSSWQSFYSELPGVAQVPYDFFRIEATVGDQIVSRDYEVPVSPIADPPRSSDLEAIAASVPGTVIHHRMKGSLPGDLPRVLYSLLNS